MKDIGIHDRCFVELKEYLYSDFRRNFSADIDEYLFERGLCSRKRDKFVFNFTGFVMSRNEILVVFPKAYVLPSKWDELKNHILILAKTLLKYRQEGSLKEEERELLGGLDCTRPFGIAPALAIIKDFEEFGYIRRETIVRRSNTGNNHDWPRTLKVKSPIISGGRPVYVDLLVRRPTIDFNNILYRLHRFAVQKSYDKYGWIIGKDNFESDPAYAAIPCEPGIAAYTLQKEIESTNIDREIRLIKSLMEFIIGSGDQEDRMEIETIATPYFHTVWETICSYVFRNDYPLYARNMPRPIWHWGTKTERTSQIPDIIFRHNGTLYILDAKYYDTARNLPGWHDLVKQFYYYYSMASSFSSDIRNALIFPGRNDTLIEYSGYVDMENFPGLGKVDAVSISTFEAIKCYSEDSMGSFFDKITDMLGNVRVDNAIST